MFELRKFGDTRTPEQVAADSAKAIAEHHRIVKLFGLDKKDSEEDIVDSYQDYRADMEDTLEQE